MDFAVIKRSVWTGHVPLLLLPLLAGVNGGCSSDPGSPSLIDSGSDLTDSGHGMPGLGETPEAFPNPMKGFRPSRYIPETGFRDHEYASVYKHCIRYQDLESQADDSVEKIREWSDEQWAELAARNLKVIPRVVLLYPSEGEFWGDIPHDGTPLQWVWKAVWDGVDITQWLPGESLLRGGSYTSRTDRSRGDARYPGRLPVRFPQGGYFPVL